MNILFKLSGSIACYKACGLISQLVKAGHAVQTVTSASALRFVGAATLEGLTERPNLSDMWSGGKQMAHIRLVEWADLTLLCPATANTLNRLAAGIGDDLLSTLFLAHDFSKPYLVAPAMNPRMLSHPATSAALEKLEKWGVHVLPTGEGLMACGDYGFGKLLEPDLIFARLLPFLQPPKASGSAHALRKKILITAGGTEEPIDTVRVITNLSSGKTGAAITGIFHAAGHEVCLLCSRRAATPDVSGIRIRRFRTTSDLGALLRDELSTGGYDAVIHAAAVGDFMVEEIRLEGKAKKAGRKLKSNEPLQLILKPGPKLLPELKRWAGNNSVQPWVAGFKLTDSLEETEPVLALLKTDTVDAVVHNPIKAVDAEGIDHPCRIYLRDGTRRDVATKTELAKALLEWIESPTPATPLASSGERSRPRGE